MKEGETYMSSSDPPAKSGFSIRCSCPHSIISSLTNACVCFKTDSGLTLEITLHREIRLEPLDLSELSAEQKFLKFETKRMESCPYSPIH